MCVTCNPLHIAGPEQDLLYFGDLISTCPALTGLYFHFFPHSAWTELSPQLGLGFRKAGDGMSGSLMGVGGRQESSMGP